MPCTWFVRLDYWNVLTVLIPIFESFPKVFHISWNLWTIELRIWISQSNKNLVLLTCKVCIYITPEPCKRTISVNKSMFGIFPYLSCSLIYIHITIYFFETMQIIGAFFSYYNLNNMICKTYACLCMIGWFYICQFFYNCIFLFSGAGYDTI